jgi:hypothetical protein
MFSSSGSCCGRSLASEAWRVRRERASDLALHYRQSAARFTSAHRHLFSCETQGAWRGQCRLISPPSGDNFIPMGVPNTHSDTHPNTLGHPAGYPPIVRDTTGRCLLVRHIAQVSYPRPWITSQPRFNMMWRRQPLGPPRMRHARAILFFPLSLGERAVRHDLRAPCVRLLHAMRREQIISSRARNRLP